MFSIPPAIAPGYRTVDESEHDLLRRAGNRLRTRAANAIDRHRWNLNGNAAMKGCLSSGVHLIAGLDHVSHDDSTNILALEFRTIHCRADDRGAKIGRRHLLEGPTIGTDRGAHGAADDDFARVHDYSPFGMIIR